MAMLAIDSAERPNFVELEEHLSKMLDLGGSMNLNSQSMTESELQTSTTHKSIRRSMLGVNNLPPPGLRPLEEEHDEPSSLPDEECSTVAA